MVIKLIISAVIGYLLGSFNGAQIIAGLNNVEIKKEGSGNAGMTNVLRVMGKKAAVITLLADSLKAVIACLVGKTIGGENALYLAGVFCVLGHNWPAFFSFKGGKGVLTTFIVLIMIDWKVALMMFGLFLFIVAITRYISLGSIISASLFPIVAICLNRPIEEILASAFLGLLIVLRHSSNIVRLIHGEENKFGGKKKDEE